MIFITIGALPVTAKKVGGWEANNPTAKDVILPNKAVEALLNIPWMAKYYHGANPIRPVSYTQLTLPTKA